jgi:protein associated with RNAse G/E
MDIDLKVQSDALKTLLETEEENYKAALQMKVPFDTLKLMRSNIKKLKADLQILLDRESINKTGELRDGFNFNVG